MIQNERPSRNWVYDSESQSDAAKTQLSLHLAVTHCTIDAMYLPGALHRTKQVVQLRDWIHTLAYSVNFLQLFN